MSIPEPPPSFFKPATNTQHKVRLALHGPSGAGKTYWALAVARGLGGRVALGDTEEQSAAKYAPPRGPFVFDHASISAPYHPDRFVTCLQQAAKAGYATCILDSLSHSWNGEGGFLELVDAEAKRLGQVYRTGKPDSYAAWKAITPIYNRLIKAIIMAPCHVIVTMRAKQDYHKGTDGKITKVGINPEMRDNFQYELDVEGSLNMDNELIIGKTRCSALAKKVFQPGDATKMAEILRQWCDLGAPAAEPAAPAKGAA